MIADAAARVMVDVIASVKGFKAPAQRRTLRRTADILTAATRLMMERPYSDVSLQDIAEAAGCSIASIYARFTDKETLIPALHLLMLESYRPILGAELNLDRVRGSSLEEFAVLYTRIVEHYHFHYRQLIRSCLAINPATIYAQINDMMDSYTARMNGAVHVLVGRTEQETEGAVRHAIRIVTAIYRDAVLGEDVFRFPEATGVAHIFATIIRDDVFD